MCRLRPRDRGAVWRAAGRHLASWRWPPVEPCPMAPGQRPISAFRTAPRSLGQAGMSPADVIRINAFVTDRAHMHGRARRVAGWCHASYGLDPCDRLGLHPPGVSDRGRGNRRKVPLIPICSFSQILPPEAKDRAGWRGTRQRRDKRLAAHAAHFGRGLSREQAAQVNTPSSPDTRARHGCRLPALVPPNTARMSPSRRRGSARAR